MDAVTTQKDRPLPQHSAPLGASRSDGQLDAHMIVALDELQLVLASDERARAFAAASVQWEVSRLGLSLPNTQRCRGDLDALSRSLGEMRGVSIARDDRYRATGAFDVELIDLAAFVLRHRLERKIIDDQEGQATQLSQQRIARVVEPTLAQRSQASSRHAGRACDSGSCTRGARA